MDELRGALIEQLKSMFKNLIYDDVVGDTYLPDRVLFTDCRDWSGGTISITQNYASLWCEGALVEEVDLCDPNSLEDLAALISLVWGYEHIDGVDVEQLCVCYRKRNPEKHVRRSRIFELRNLGGEVFVV